MSPTHPRKHLAALLLGAAALLTHPALAQTTTPSSADQPATDNKVAVEQKPASDQPQPDKDTLKLEPVEVTGSRIRSLVGEQTALPVFTLDQAELEHRGVTRLADIRWAIPQLGGAAGFNDNLTNGGTSRAQTVSTSFNLRGLGGNSTLVLIDGHRVPRGGQEAPGGAGGREDFNVDGIPISAIERIDVLSESAGAIYGSEGIAGVINIVLKKNYTGAELNVTYDNSFNTDVAGTTVSLTAGYRQGKLSTFISASTTQQNGLASRDRYFSFKSAFPEFGGSTSFLLSQPASGPGSLSSTSSPQNGGASLPGLTTNIVGIPAGSNGTTAANNNYTTSVAAPFDPASYSFLIDPQNTRSVVMKLDYDYKPWLQPYLEARWTRFLDYTYGTPPTLTFTSLPAGYIGNPFAGPVVLRKVFYDLGPTLTIGGQENEALTYGVKGSLFSDWRYDATGAFARNIVTDDPVSAFFNTTLVSAAINNVDPTQHPNLAYDSSAVTDPNPAGLLNSLRPLFPHRDTSDVYDYTVQADGTVWSGWAGDMKMAVGGEITDEKVKFHRVAGDSSLAFVLTKPFSRHETAAFAEGSVPLLSDKQHIPFVHRLEIGAAIRAEDYSDIGAQTSPSYHGLFQPFSWLTFRASRAEGFKAPKLYDLLAPITTTISTLTVASNVHDSLRGGEQVLGTVNSVSGGNPNLAPETSTSKNWGFVMDAPLAALKGLSLSVDHYDLLYNNRIGAPSRQVLIDFFPNLVTRAAPSASDPAGYAGLITGFNTSNINLAYVRTRGWDYQLSYQKETALGGVSLSAGYSEPGKVITKATPAATATASGQPSRFTGSAFWNRKAWEAGLAVNYQNKYYVNGPLTSIPYPSYIEWNPQVSYDFGKDKAFAAGTAGHWWGRMLAGSKFTVTVVNAFNKGPAPADIANGRIVMDPRLSRYILSVTKKF